MSGKFRNRNRIPSNRLYGWDYGWAGAYFITICTGKCGGAIYRTPHFGSIINHEMILSAAGKIAFSTWQKIPEQFNYIQLDAFVIMPDHMHGILIINPVADVRVRLIAPQPNPQGGKTGNKNPMLHDNISRVIRWYKGRCTYEINSGGAINRAPTDPNPIPQSKFKWQRGFHDKIIWDITAIHRFQKYIEDNPLKWDKM